MEAKHGEEGGGVGSSTALLLFVKEHSQFRDRTDLDTNFSHFEKSSPQPKINVHHDLAICSNLGTVIFNTVVY